MDVRSSKAACLWMLSLWLAVAAAAGAASKSEAVNVTAGMYWSTALDEQNLDRGKEMNESDDEGFSSMESMLQWALGQADPDKLRDAAQDMDQVGRAQADIREVLDNLQVTSDAHFMKIAISDLRNTTLSMPDRVRALRELLELVESIDNANDMHKLGGLELVVEQLQNENPEVRTVSAWVLGQFSQNNPVVQTQVVDAGALPILMRLVRAQDKEEAVKALYAVASVVRDLGAAQTVFYSEGGSQLLDDIISNCTADARLRKKSLQLVGDLADHQSAAASVSRELLKSVVQLTHPGEDTDLDMQEKALMALQGLGSVSDEVRRDLLHFCQVESALDRMKQQLEELVEQGGEAAEFARELELLRRNVLETIISPDRHHSTINRDDT